ncbi:MAG: 6-pyruvoyl-tetrahydropterin synthase-related protein, partial [Patescibacteria group bacterium]|nr:6-pyruvoyl-tetrahydropterin synthase-related protein [Patescibacteria group bacterium]
DLGYGYGYPIFNFYGPLPYYVGGTLYAIGFSGLVATKIMMILGMFLPGFLLFLIVSRLFGSIVGLVSAIVYGYFPYHAVQLYVRGAVGESWILIFLPLIFGSLYFSLSEKKYDLSVFFGILGFSGTILSHTILGFTTVVFCIVFLSFLFIFSIIRKFSLLPLLIVCIGLFGGLGVSAFFWLPALFEMRYTAVSDQIRPSASVENNFVCLQQLWYSPWGYGGSIPGCNDGLSFMLGKINIILILAGVIGLYVSWKIPRQRMIGLFGIGIVLLSIFFMLEISKFLWKIFPAFSFVQYPWRFLAYTAFGVSLLSISFLQTIRPAGIRVGIGFAIIALILFFNTKFFSPQYVYYRSPEAFETKEELRYRASKISDEYLPLSLPRPRDVSEVFQYIIPESSTYTFKQLINKETYKKIEFTSSSEQQIRLYHAHFPGWRYWVNSIEQSLRLDQGRPVISIPENFSTLEMKFTNTPVRFFGTMISIITVIVVGYFYGKKAIS